MFINREDPPDEEEQVEQYRRLLAAAEGRPVVVRTLDTGGDKLPFAPTTIFRNGASSTSARLLRYSDMHIPVNMTASTTATEHMIRATNFMRSFLNKRYSSTRR